MGGELYVLFSFFNVIDIYDYLFMFRFIGNLTILIISTYPNRCRFEGVNKDLQNSTLNISSVNKEL